MAVRTPRMRNDLTRASISDVLVELPALGTASTRKFVVPRQCRLVYVAGVSHADGPGTGGPSEVTLNVTGEGDIALLSFPANYIGEVIEDTLIVVHTLYKGDIVTVVSNGAGDHTAGALLTLTFQSV